MKWYQNTTCGEYNGTNVNSRRFDVALIRVLCSNVSTYFNVGPLSPEHVKQPLWFMIYFCIFVTFSNFLAASVSNSWYSNSNLGRYKSNILWRIYRTDNLASHPKHLSRFTSTTIQCGWFGCCILHNPLYGSTGVLSVKMDLPIWDPFSKWLVFPEESNKLQCYRKLNRSCSCLQSFHYIKLFQCINC